MKDAFSIIVELVTSKLVHCTEKRIVAQPEITLSMLRHSEWLLLFDTYENKAIIDSLIEGGYLEECAREEADATHIDRHLKLTEAGECLKHNFEEGMYAR